MAPEYNTFSSNAKAVALTLLTIVSSTSAMDSVPITVPHAIVERYEMTSSSLQLEEYDSFKLDLSAKKNFGEVLYMEEVSKLLFDGISTFTDYEIEAHEKKKKKLSIDSGVNILAYL